MAGILDFFSNPANQGLLNLSAGLLQAGGPSPTPVSFGQALGQGMQRASGAMQAAQLAESQKKLIDLHGKLYGSQAGKLDAETARLARLQQIMKAEQPAAPQVGFSESSAASMGAPWLAASNFQQPSPLDAFKTRATTLANEGFLTEANQVADLVKKLNPELEFKDGVWYNKTTGAPVRGGAFVNQQGFGGQMSVGSDGQITALPLPGSAGLYGQQQAIGERTRAAHDLVTVPPTSPTAPPTFASRLSLLGGAGGPQAAGMTPLQTSQVAADAAQSTEVSKNYGKIYNDLQNASMANPGKIAKFQRIGDLLKDFDGGKMSGVGLELARGFNSFGFKIDSKLPNKEAAEALTNEIALELRSTGQGQGMPGAMSDKDREFLKQMTPQMAQTAEGRKLVIESRVKVMERENHVARMARQYKKKYGKLDEDFFSQLSEWSNRNQLFQ